MKFSRLLIACLLLLAIMTLGVVSASGDFSADGALLTEEIGDESVENVLSDSIIDTPLTDGEEGGNEGGDTPDPSGGCSTDPSGGDTPDPSGGCSTDPSGGCSTDPSGGDTPDPSTDEPVYIENGKFSDIQSLIDAASANSVVNIAPGTYYGSKSNITVNKPLTIDGHGSTLDAKGLSNIFYIRDVAVTLKNIKFINSKSDYGAVFLFYADAVINNCTFRNCNATTVGKDALGYGGAIRSHYGNKLTVTGCDFNDCHGKVSAGAIYSTAKNNAISNCNFKKCSAIEAATVYVKNGTSSFNNCNFTGCVATNNSGAIYSHYSKTTIKNCNFVNCKAQTRSGGAIRSYLDTCKVYNSNFVGCYAGGNSGGAFYSHSGNVLLQGCTFENNTCKNSGGSIRLFDAKGSVKNCKIKNSQARLGGAICSSEKSSCPISGCTIEGCNASEYGGGVYCTDACSITNTAFKNCYSKGSGGGLAYSTARGTIKGCNFTNCHSDGNGGAINSYRSTCNFVNCKFNACKSKKDGGASFSGEGRNKFTSCTFTSCTGLLGAAVRSYNDVCSAASCKFVKCTPKNKNGDAVYSVACEKCSFSPKLSYTFKITGSNLGMLYTSGKYLKVRVLNKNKAVPAGKAISFVINGKTTKANTDKNGYAKIKINLPPKTHEVLVTFGGVAVIKKVVVKHILSSANYKVRKTAKSLALTGKLARVNGKYLKGKVIAFKLNGKTYKAKTNAKGVAKVTVPKSVISKLKIQKYDLTLTYMKDTIKKAVTVVK